MPSSRRSFLKRSVAVSTALALPLLREDWLDRLQAADQLAGGRPPGDLAADESFWFHIQRAFEIDRSLINLNNGGVCPSPRFVFEAMRRHEEYANQAPARHLWNVQDPQVELVRIRLARTFGCDPAEMALTRNASEALQIAINGIDLKPGDEFLTTTHDYPRMLHTIRQRQLREGIALRQVSLPVPATSHDELFRLFEEAVTPRTKVILVCHVVNLTGQIMPVRRICEMARRRGILSIVDGAHAFAQFPFTCEDVRCDYYGVSLHKWLTAPVGTGFLYVRGERIKDTWPLTAAEEPRSENIRKFEEIGTHPDAARLAIAEALTFYEGIGPERKAARLRYLRDRWAGRVGKLPGVRMHTNLDPGHSCALGSFKVEGVEPGRLAEHLWRHHKIIVAPMKHGDYEGIRVTPNVYTSLADLDLFCAAMETVAREGLPPPPADKP
jgi:selenocysteine lyase/cysteine desulfurase